MQQCRLTNGYAVSCGTCSHFGMLSVLMMVEESRSFFSFLGFRACGKCCSATRSSCICSGVLKADARSASRALSRTSSNTSSGICGPRKQQLKEGERVIVVGRWSCYRYLSEDVSHGFAGQVLQVLLVLDQTLKELHTSQHHLGFLQSKANTLKSFWIYGLNHCFTKSGPQRWREENNLIQQMF